MASSEVFDTTLTASPLICTGRLLDNIPKTNDPMALAFGLRKVSTAYSGPCIRVRRSSDNREEDIGFTQTDLDIESLVTFAAGFDVYVVRWYDQSGQKRDAYQLDAQYQPIIVQNGIMKTDNNENRATMEFNGSYFLTDWTPTESEMQEGAGMLITGAAGINNSVQGGTVTEQDVTVVAKSDFPNPYLAEGWDTFYYEGLKITTSGGKEETVYIQDSTLTHLTIDPASGKKSAGKFTVFHYSSAGGNNFLIDRNQQQPATDQWYTTLSGITGTAYIKIIGFSEVVYTVTSISDIDPNYYQVTLEDPNGNKPEPPPESTLNLDLLEDRTLIAKTSYGIPAPGGPPSISVDTLSTGITPVPTNQYRRGVKAGGRIFAVPYDATKVLEIDHKYSYISSIKITDAGSGYTLNQGVSTDITVTINYVIDAADGEEQATLDTPVLGPGGVLIDIPVIIEGKYKNPPKITIGGGTGDPATAATVEATMSRVRVHDITPIYANVTLSQKWWMGVTDATGDYAYCIPAKAEYVLKIDASTDTTSFSIIGSSQGTTDNKWHDGVLGSDGNIYGIPHNSSQVLKITPSNDDVSLMTETYGINNMKWSAGCAVYDKIFGIPWDAATMLVIDTTFDNGDGTLGTSYLRGSTGHTPTLPEGNLRSSRGYHRRPDHATPLIVDSPGNGGETMQIETTGVNFTKCITEVRVKPANQGSGYSSSPTVRIEYPGGTWYNTYPTAQAPSPFKGTMEERFHPTEGYSLGYSITGITLTKSGDGFAPSTGKPNIYITGGKGNNATARAIVTDGKVVTVIIQKPGSGYVNWQTIEIEIRGGGGSGALYRISEKIADDVFVPPSYSDSGGGFLTSTGGYLVPNQALEQVSSGSGYRSRPTVIIRGGKGDDTIIQSDDIDYTTDGKIVEIPIPSGWNGGNGYTVETVAEASNPNTQHLKVASPTENGVKGQVGGVRAIARVAEVNGNDSTLGATGSISKIELINCGQGYVDDAKVTVIDRNGSSGANPTDNLFARYAPDGRISGLRTIPGTTYSRYINRPGITGLNNRAPEDGSNATTPGSASSATIILDGRASALDQKTPYEYWGANGYDKFVGAHVYDPSRNQPTIFSVPYGNTCRGLRVALPGPGVAIPDDICFDVNDIQNYDGFDPRGFGNGYGKFSSLVASLNEETVYAVPYNFNIIAKIVCSTGNPEYVTYGGSPTRFLRPRGRWLDGVLAYNGCIYCMPANTNSLLVIDTKTEFKSETITFTNIRGSQNQKWWSAVRAGSTPAEGMIYGIPSDLGVVLELNPGIPLRSKSLPALGTVASLPINGVANVQSGNLIVYPPGLITKDVQDNDIRQIVVYEADTGTSQTFDIPGENTTYSEGVFLNDGTVAFIPTYNSADAFTYTGKLGMFDLGKAMTGDFTSISDYFSYTQAGFVSAEQAAIYPSRSAVRLGTQFNQVVAWTPSDGTQSTIVYDKVRGRLLTDTDFVGGLGERTQNRVRLTTSTLIGSSTQGRKVVSTLPSPAIADKEPDIIPGEALNAILLPSGAIVIIPGDGNIDFEVYYPDDPNAPRNITPENATSTQKVTKIELPELIRLEHAKVSNVFRHIGCVRIGSNLYCIPYSYPTVLVLNYETYVITELENDDLTDQFVNGMYWDAVIGNGKIYCLPYNAPKVMVIDPSDPFDPISFIDIDLNTGLQGGVAGNKWFRGTLMSDGRIAAAPFQANTLLLIDPNTHALTFEPFSWLSNTSSEKFSDVKFVNNKLYFIPYQYTSVVVVDLNDSPYAVEEYDLKLGGGNKFLSGAVAPNGRIYLIPYAVNYVYEFNPENGDVNVLEQSFYVNNRYRNPIKYGCSVLARNGKIYSFAQRGDGIIIITPFNYVVSVFDYTNQPHYEEISVLPRQYLLRPFTLKYDPEYVLFHTAGTFSILDANSYSTNMSYTQVISGPRIQDGIPTHFPNIDDVVVSANGTTLSTIYPFQGGVAGIKSFSGNAEMYCSIIDTDLQFNMGDSTISLGRVFDSLYANSSMGVFAAYSSNVESTTQLYVRDVVVNGVPYLYEGQTGEGTFTIGRVEGLKVNEGEFNTPGFRQGFNGQMSELVIFSSDQQERASTLGENASFFYLDSEDNRIGRLYGEDGN